MSYLEGQGVPRDRQLAIKWFKAAAEQGDEKSHRRLAEMYDRGEGVKRDLKEAFRWYAKSAVNGDLVAQLTLAKLYFEGRGIERDVIKAQMWSRILGGDGEVGSLITFSGGEISVGEQSRSIRVDALKLAKKLEQGMSDTQIEQANLLRKACVEEQDVDRYMVACGLQ